MARRSSKKSGGSDRWAHGFTEWAARVGGGLSVRGWLTLIAALVLVGGALVARQLTREAYQMDVFRVDPLAGIEVEVPPGIPSAWKREVADAGERLARQAPISIFSDEDLERVSDEFQRISWVRRVDEIERRFPDRLFVRTVARRPVARLSQNGRADWADAEGAFLPSPGSDTAGRERFRLLPRVLIHTTEAEENSSRAPSALRGYGRPAHHPAFRAACATAAQLQELEIAARLPGWRLRWIDARGFERIQERRRRGASSEVPECEIVLYFDALGGTDAAEEVVLTVEWGAPPPFPGYLPGAGQEFLRDAEERLRLLQTLAADLPAGGRVSVHLGLSEGEVLGR